MGNRAVITFEQKPTPQSVGIYLHWNGGPESVLGFLTVADKYGVRGAEDAPYELARVVQIIANFFGGTTSVGVGTLDSLDCDNHDNGVYVCKRGGGEPQITHFPSGDYQSAHGVKLNNETIRQSKYWESDENGVPGIVATILEKNNPVFAPKKPVVVA